MARNHARYLLDEHGLFVEKVGPWATDKLKIVADYAYASGGARKSYLSTGAAYIDVFSGPGRSQIRDTGALVDGSPIAAFKKSLASPGRFTTVCISDADAGLLSSCEQRLRELNAPVHAVPGPASLAMPQIIEQLHPAGLHFAFLDPHNLGTLSFDLFESLARLRRIDILVHVSLSDLQRNADRYTSKAHDQFDHFAPGWREQVSADMNQERLRAEILKFWSKKIYSLGLPQARHCELIRGTQNQRLYWLIFLARHELAHKLWIKISSLGRAPELDL